MSRISTLLISLSLVCAICIAGEAQAVPADISVLAKAAKSIEEGIDSDASKSAGEYYKKELLLAMEEVRLAVANRLSQARGYARIVDLTDSRLRDAFSRPLEGAIQKAVANSNIAERRRMLYDLLIQASAAKYTEEIIAAHYQFPGPGGLITQKNIKTAAPTFSDQVSLVSETPRLAFLADHSSLAMDIGGSGSGNQVIDVGEWVHLELAVSNVSALPYFSSSAFVKSDTECLWVPASREYLFPELPPYKAPNPGAKKKSPPPIMGKVSTWVYLSHACRDGERATVRLMVKDTHRTRGTQHLMRASLLVRNRAKTAAVNYLIDHDIPGWSDGDEAPPIGHGRQVELSHGLRVEPIDFVRAYKGWGVRGEFKPLLAFQEFRADQPMIQQGEVRSVLLPGDDFDLKFVPRAKWDVSIKPIASKLRWSSPRDAGMMTATDVLVLYKDPNPINEPKVIVETVIEKTEVTCADGFDNDEDGLTDCDDPDCEGENHCVCGPDGPDPLNSSAVAGLFKRHSKITPRPAQPETRGAVRAVSIQGYELLFDEGTFKKEYDCLVNGIPLERCGIPECVDCDKKMAPPKIEKITVRKTVEGSGAPRYVAYRYRYYFMVPLSWEPQPELCDNGRDDDEDGLVDCNDKADCEYASNCTPETLCNDGVDNDNDRATDCADRDCRYAANCIPERVCDDGVDNDSDGNIDCADSDCEYDPACIEEEVEYDGPRLWVDLGLHVGFHDYTRVIGLEESEESFALTGARAHLTYAAFPKQGIGLHLAAWFIAGEKKSSPGFTFGLAYLAEVTPWLELSPHFGVGLQDFNLENLGNIDVDTEPRLVGVFNIGFAARFLPFLSSDLPLYLFLDGGYRQLLSQPRTQVGDKVDEGTGNISVGVGYRL